MRIRVQSTLTLGPGAILTLSGHQATRRAHALDHIGGDRYRARVPVEFKVGEEFGYEGDLPKALATCIDAKPPGKVARKGSAPLVADPAQLGIE